MSTDVLADLGPIFLGSRLKRLAERLQAGAARVAAEAGMTVQPSQMPILAALDRGPMTVGGVVEAIGFSQPGVTRAVGQLEKLGLVRSTRGADQRRRTLSLTPAGEAALTRAKLLVWQPLEAAVGEICANLSGPLLDQVAAIEAALAAAPLDVRSARVGAPSLRVVEFNDDLAPTFHRINAEWITAMYRLEATDIDLLENPRARIVEPGGAILFVEAPGLGVVGTCALKKTGEAAFELTKMGVTAAARGLKAGEFLLTATIARAKALGAETLYLLSNKKSVAAIHLYEKLGFVHDAQIMARYGAVYERCDVAMRYRG
ncbi:MAG TPA: bifunctional helix-turn-helix transcriptional regulator/GNAT family N-acetyltransferase [Caulobacteraceae bacterium]